MHASRVKPTKKWPVRAGLALDKIDCCGGSLVVDCLHALPGERPGVLDLAVGGRSEHSARTKFFAEFRIARIGSRLWVFFRVEMIEIPKKLVEAVVCRQIFVAVAQMVLTKLT